MGFVKVLVCFNLIQLFPYLTFSETKVISITAKEILSSIPKLEAKVVIVNVWATWCEPCREEFPAFVKLYQKYKNKGVKLLFVSANEVSEMKNIQKFLSENQVDFQTYIQKEDAAKFINTLSPQWSGALPTTFIYDKKGTLHFFLSRPLTYKELEQKVLLTLNK